MTGGNNTRVTLAVLDTKLDGIHRDVKAVKEAQAAHADQIHDNETEIARLQERVGIIALANAGFTAIGSFIAGLVGIKN